MLQYMLDLCSTSTSAFSVMQRIALHSKARFVRLTTVHAAEVLFSNMLIYAVHVCAVPTALSQRVLLQHEAKALRALYSGVSTQQATDSFVRHCKQRMSELRNPRKLMNNDGVVELEGLLKAIGAVGYQVPLLPTLPYPL
jgi:hypothetical protein